MKRWILVTSIVIAGSLLLAGILMATSSGGTVGPAANRGDPAYNVQRIRVAPGKPGAKQAPETVDEWALRDDWFYARRMAPLNYLLPGAYRKAAEQTLAMRAKQAPSNPNGYGGAWTAIGPAPIRQYDYTLTSLRNVSGRVSAIAIAPTSPYTIYLGGAQGGVWISTNNGTSWTPKTDQMPSLAIGAIAIAPSNPDILYAGTGEGNLSGDSYFGNGVLKSTDAGNTWAIVSGDVFTQVSFSKIVIHPTDANILYGAVLRGIVSSRRSFALNPTANGVYKSTDGGVTWTGVNINDPSDQIHGATDLVIDPQEPNTLVASFWGRGISQTVDGGLTWFTAMNGLPTDADYGYSSSPVPGGTRFSLTLSRPSSGVSATLYTGFDYWSADHTTYYPSTVWKSTDGAANWSQTSTDVVENYCGGQCRYDNVLLADPTDPNVVFVGGQFDYTVGSGGVYRSLDGGTTWVDMGYLQHPDFHAIAMRPGQTEYVYIGSDGGIWYSPDRGGSGGTGVDWTDLNNTNLQISQFTSGAQHPTNTNFMVGGTQDNGLPRRTTSGGTSWTDVAGGDGGASIVDYSDPNYVYGNFFGISPYRFDDGAANLYTYQAILYGLNTGDTSQFYPPFIQDQGVPTRLYYGTYQVYRTDNRGDLWQLISPPLTEGSPNGGLGDRVHGLTALASTAGSAVYAGAFPGEVWLTTDASVISPTWTRLDSDTDILPPRPVTAISVDRSDYRLAYLAYAGFSAATPTEPGHVFKTTDAGVTWTNVSGNLPDVPVNSVVLDPADQYNTVYIGTDTGAFVTTDGGGSWVPLGTDLPIVGVWWMDLNPRTGLLRAATHGRGMWSLADQTSRPALVLTKLAGDTPIGPNGLVTYTLTLQNIGQAEATGVTITDTIPVSTTFVSASGGGVLVGNQVVWSNLTLPAVSGSISVELVVRTDGNVVPGDPITNLDYRATSAEGPAATGSPYTVYIAPPYNPTLSPLSIGDWAKPGATIAYTVSIRNAGYLMDSYNLSVSGNEWTTTIWDADFTHQITSTAPVLPGDTTVVGIRVDVPASAGQGATDTASFIATSAGNPTVSVSATVETHAAVELLLLDDDHLGNFGPAPDVEQYYTTTLNQLGIPYDYWDLEAEGDALTPHLLSAHKIVVWFTGGSYPNPITPYEPQLAAYLDGGGRLLMTGEDILDQSGGTTDFVRDYLHIDWDGSETQNDKGTITVTGVVTNPVFADLGEMALDYAKVGIINYSDWITVIAPGVPATFDAVPQVPNVPDNIPDGVSVSADGYKVIFLAWPMEALSDTDRSAVMSRALNWLGSYQMYLPVIAKNP